MCTLRTWPARGWKVCGGNFFWFRASLSSPPSSCPSRSSSFFVSWLSGLYAPLSHECVPALVGEPLRPKRTSRLPPVPFAGPAEPLPCRSAFSESFWLAAEMASDVAELNCEFLICLIVFADEVIELICWSRHVVLFWKWIVAYEHVFKNVGPGGGAEHIYIYKWATNPTNPQFSVGIPHLDAGHWEAFVLKPWISCRKRWVFFHEVPCIQISSPPKKRGGQNCVDENEVLKTNYPKVCMTFMFGMLPWNLPIFLLGP